MVPMTTYINKWTNKSDQIPLYDPTIIGGAALSRYYADLCGAADSLM